MTSINVATVEFVDPSSQQEGVVIVRIVDGRVALCLSLQTDGDVETVLSVEDASTIARALLKAAQG